MNRQRALYVNVPFGPAFAEHGAQILARAQASEGASCVLGDDAFVELTSRRLSDIADVTLPSLFAHFRNEPGRRSLDPRAHAGYDSFLDRLCGGLFAEVIAGCPELRRLVEAMEMLWDERIRTMIKRIVADHESMADAHGTRPPFVHARPVGDTGVVLEGIGGERVVYKHRRQAMDTAFGLLLAELNTWPIRHQFRIARTTDRGSYGWCEAIDTDAGFDSAGARLYQAGMLLAVTHALAGGDLHESNVRAVGANMIVLDAEKVLRPRVGIEPVDHHSVLNTGLLPTDTLFERCGLASEHWNSRPRKWQGVGTDAVRRQPTAHWTQSLRASIVEFFARERRLITDAVTAGFREMYGLIAESGLPLDVFEGCSPRVILRNSAHYHRALERSFEPAALASPSRRNEIFEALAAQQVPAAATHPHLMPAIGRFECEALERQELPRFHVEANGRDLLCQGEVIGELFAEGALDRARRVVASLSPSACDAQSVVIETAIASLAENRPPIGQPTVVSRRSLADVFA